MARQIGGGIEGEWAGRIPPRNYILAILLTADETAMSPVPV